ncbi:aromatic compound dioxygenase, partial [Cylindrobasidium torrendii FP15055 ss-10]
ARNCAAEISAFKAKRMAKRNLGRRDVAASVTATAANPHVTSIDNDTCVTAPETVEGPYYINNEYVRYDLIEDQEGVPLVIDVGVIDTNTCEPLPGAFVDIWAANSTGVYGGYPAQLGALERNETFLRGGQATDENGIAEIKTLYPGFYQGRTAHVHTFIITDYEVADNGTIISHAGSLVHIGQFFFDEDWNDQVYAIEPYVSNTNNRTLNTQDGILAEANTDGYNSFLDLSLLGEDLSDGILGYITVGVDTTASYTIQNGNYNPV